MVKARFNSTGDTAFAGALFQGRNPGGECPFA